MLKVVHGLAAKNTACCYNLCYECYGAFPPGDRWWCIRPAPRSGFLMLFLLMLFFFCLSVGPTSTGGALQPGRRILQGSGLRSTVNLAFSFFACLSVSGTDLHW